MQRTMIVIAIQCLVLSVACSSADLPGAPHLNVSPGVPGAIPSEDVLLGSGPSDVPTHDLGAPHEDAGQAEVTGGTSVEPDSGGSPDGVGVTDVVVSADGGAPDGAGVADSGEATCLDADCILCRPCVADVDCGGDSRCIEHGPDGRYCATPCEDDAACPSGFECAAGDGGGLCLPADGADCPCLGAFADFVTICAVAVDGLECQAFRTCDAPCPTAGPLPEACNGADDDCDGEVDEGLGEVTCGVAKCAHMVPACVDGHAGPCDAFVGATVEECNGEDDDCDGAKDEDLGEIDCGEGACAHPIPACQAGAMPLCDPLLGAAEESCNGVDDDCDGQVDEELGEVPCGSGPCVHMVPACVGGALGPCDPFEGALDESCNGLDDDCDGEVDEGLGELTCGVGPCAHSVPACAAGGAVACDAYEGAAPESCNAVDDDCDGEVDEELGEISCGVGACAHSVPACSGGEDATCDPYEGSADESCNGTDDDCDGQVDELLGDITCGVGKCKTTVAACAGGALQTCTPKAPGTEACNGVDDDCDGQIDESGCPCPAVASGGHTYLLCDKKRTWWTARDDCKKAGSGYHLVSITSADENAAVASAAKAVNSASWWIGLSDEGKEGTWVWDNGEGVTYGPNWASGEPNNSGNEDCAIIGPSSGKWVDAGCYEVFPYVCEHE